MQFLARPLKPFASFRIFALFIILLKFEFCQLCLLAKDFISKIFLFSRLAAASDGKA
jgi:hypothetical protein